MLLYGDTLDGAPAQSAPSNSSTASLPDNSARWARPMITDTIGSSIHRTALAVVAGELSDRQLLLQNSSNSSQFDLHWGFARAFVSATNTESAHVIGAAFKWQKYNDVITTYRHPVIGWNDALDYQGGGTVTLSTFWDEFGLTIEDGILQLGSTQSSSPIPENNFVYLELELDPNTAKGSVYVNNIKVIDSASISGLSDITKIGFILGYPRVSTGTIAMGQRHYFDNIYILDGTGAAMNQRLGPVAFRRMPLLAASSLAFSPVNTASNLDAVNKNDLDTSTFNRSPGSNDVGDHFTVDTALLDPDIEILGVIANGFATKTDLGERGLELVVTENSQQVRRKFPDTVINYSGLGEVMFLPKAPDDTAWTLDKLDLMTVGYEVKEQ